MIAETETTTGIETEIDGEGMKAHVIERTVASMKEKKRAGGEMTIAKKTACPKVRSCRDISTEFTGNMTSTNFVFQRLARRGDHRLSATPPRSPLGKVGRANHDSHSPLPTRTRYSNKGPGKLPVRDDAYDDDSSQKSGSARYREPRDSVEEDEERGRKPTSEKGGGEEAMDEDDDIAVEDDAMSAMQAMMGFGGFGTTKGQKVPGNNSGAVYKAKKTEYRQYMNRIGGFNRPLSPGR